MKNTLQARLITLMVIAAIFLIATFTAIQLHNQLRRSAESNLYRANMGAIFTRDKLQRLFSKLDRATPPTVIKRKIKDIFLSELESRVIDNAILLDEKGTMLISEGKIEKVLEYNKAFLGEIYKARATSRWLFPIIDKKMKAINLFIITDNPYGYIIHLTFSLGSLKEALNDVYRPVMFTVIIVVIATIILAVLLSRTLISPVKILNQATKDIAGGNLDRKVSIKTEDELQELSDTFNYMTGELKRMRARAENANPLTKLPGNIIIREEVERKIKNNEKFMLIYGDLDNFKAFNDKYGVHAGDEVIMFTAKILEEAVKKGGTGRDFIGHEGGDDFLLLTLPEEAEGITDYIIKEFDKGIARFYSKEDTDKGYIEASSRDSDATIKYPVMSISMVGISNLKREITSYPQITNIAADLKKAAKKLKKSNFLMDRRKEDRGIEYRTKKDMEAKEAERRGLLKERRGPKERRKQSG
jgi:diguanylate cyclase (GGDEF)-like protein